MDTVADAFAHWCDRLPASTLCICLATLSGFFNTLSTLAITYPTLRAAREQEPMSTTKKMQMYIVNLLMIALSQAAGIMSNGQGPVALAFPFAAASNILTILLGQWRLGMMRPTKPVRVGTFMLASAVMILPDIGPSELPKDVDVLKLLQEDLAIGFISVCLVATIIGCYTIARDLLTDNNKLLFLYAVVGGAGTILNTSISKLVQMDVGGALKVVFVLSYILLSCVCLGVQATANASLPDPSLFVPVGIGVNLVLNFIAGLCIWGDGSRVEFPVGYAFLYVIVVMATYLLSSFDILYDLVDNADDQETDGETPRVGMSHAYSFDPYGNENAVTRLGRAMTCHHDFEEHGFNKAGRAVRDLWSMKCTDAHKLRRYVRQCLRHGLKQNMIRPSQLIEVCLDLVEESPPVLPFHSRAIMRLMDMEEDAQGDTRPSNFKSRTFCGSVDSVESVALSERFLGD